MPLKNLIDFVVLTAIWGASFLFMQIVLPDLGVMATAALRVAIAALFLLPLVARRGLLGQLRQHWRATFLVGIFNSGIPFALYAFALQQLNTGLTSILNATTPMFGAIVAWAWLKDRPSPSQITGLAIGFVGVALLAERGVGIRSGADAHLAAWSVAACLAACLCYGVAASFTKRHLGGIPSLVTATGSQIGATLALALPAWWDRPTQIPGLQTWIAVMVLGVVCTGVAYVLYFRLIERAGPARTLAVTFVIPVAAMSYGVIFLSEALTVWMLGCGAIILLGTALATGLVALPGRTREASTR
jgi:drug/metabolite transporter (DMT)-like permease